MENRLRCCLLQNNLGTRALLLSRTFAFNTLRLVAIEQKNLVIVLRFIVTVIVFSA